MASVGGSSSASTEKSISSTGSPSEDFNEVVPTPEYVAQFQEHARVGGAVASAIAEIGIVTINAVWFVSAGLHWVTLFIPVSCINAEERTPCVHINVAVHVVIVPAVLL